MPENKAFTVGAANSVVNKKGRPEAHTFINLNLVFDDIEFAPRFGLRVKDNLPPMVLQIFEKLADKQMVKGVNVTLEHIGLGRDYHSKDEYEDAALDALLGLKQGIALEEFGGSGGITYEPDIFKLYFNVTLDWIKDKNGDPYTVKVEGIGVNKYAPRQVLSLLLQKFNGDAVEVMPEVISIKDANPNTELTLDEELMKELDLVA